MVVINIDCLEQTSQVIINLSYFVKIYILIAQNVSFIFIQTNKKPPIKSLCCLIDIEYTSPS